MKFSFLTLLPVLIAFSLSAQQNDAIKTDAGISTAPDNITVPRDYAEHVQIVRDQWGVPHIYGETDPDVAYGLAWANAEDDFNTMQEAILPVKGLAGLRMGKDGGIFDFFAHAIGTNRVVDELYQADISPEFKKYIEGYAAGINAYASKYPKEVMHKKMFPVTAKDLVKGHFLSLAFISSAQNPIQNIIEGKLDDEKPIGSNMFAFSSERTQDGNTYICINPHQPFEGMFSWYEAHLVSEEGMNIMGATFPGGCSIFVGTNEHLGWSHTWNRLDITDVYRLKMHPTEKLKYEFEGEWLDLEERKVKLKVKLKKWLPRIPVKKKSYWSVHGPVFKSKEGNYFAVRYPANMDIRAVEQWFKMGKATNLEEFKEVLEMQALPRFNIVYADREDNIYFVGNGKIPVRFEGVDWTKVLPGNQAKYIWNDYYPLDSLAQITNPDCGYLYNMNNTPYDATCEEEDIPFKYFPSHMGYKLTNNNRSQRFKQLMMERESFTFEDMIEVKFDSRFPDSSKFINSLSFIYDLEPEEYGENKEVVKLMQQFDKEVKPESKPATVWLIVMDYIFTKKKIGDGAFYGELAVEDNLFREALQFTRHRLTKTFGRIDVPISEVNRHIRGNKDMPLPGFADLLAANYSKRLDDGRYKGFVGDSYTMFVSYDKDGPVRIETQHPYGASSKPDSPHYTDQMELFVDQQTKVMTLDKAEIFKNAVKVYRPK